MSTLKRLCYFGMVAYILLTTSCVSSTPSPTVTPESITTEEVVPTQTESPIPEPTSTEEAEKLKIGLVAPITGPRAKLGEDMTNAATLAENQINNNGGIEIGEKKYSIELVWGDTEANIETGVSITQRLIEHDKVVGIVGYLHSDIFLACMDVIQESRIPTVDTVAASSKIGETIAEGNEKGIVQYSFQLSPTMRDRGITHATAAEKLLNVRGLGGVFQNTDPGREIERIIDKYFKENVPDAEWVASEIVESNATEFYAELASIQAAEPEVVFVSLSGVAASAFTEQWIELDIPYLPFLDGGDFASVEYIDQFGEGVEGFVVNMIWTPDAPVTNVTVPFSEAYKEEYGVSPPYYAAQTYDGVLAMVEAIKVAGSSNREEVREGLTKIDIDGATGRLKFDPERHQIPRQMVMAQIRDGAFQVVWPLQAAEAELEWPLP